MSDNYYVQYTVRNVPLAVDAQLKALAQKEGISLNKLLLKRIGAIEEELEAQAIHHDLDWFYGSEMAAEDDVWAVVQQARRADAARQAEIDD